MGIEALREERLKQADYLEKQRIDPYPGAIPLRSHANKDVVDKFEQLKGREISVLGRITGIRAHGKRYFFDLEDESGKVQGTITVDSVGEQMFEIFQKGFGIGDFAGITGKVLKTKAGEVTVEASKFSMLAKALLPPPPKWEGLKDVQTRSRQRYLDLMMNKEVRERFKFRSKMVQSMRERFLELECC